jgi:hypothetical protein
MPVQTTALKPIPPEQGVPPQGNITINQGPTSAPGQTMIDTHASIATSGKASRSFLYGAPDGTVRRAKTVVDGVVLGQHRGDTIQAAPDTPPRSSVAALS